MSATTFPVLQPRARSPGILSGHGKLLEILGTVCPRESQRFVGHQLVTQAVASGTDSNPVRGQKSFRSEVAVNNEIP